MQKMIFKMILSFPDSGRMFLAVAFVCFWQTAFAQVEHLTEDIRVDQEPTSLFSGFPAVAVDSKDNFIITWGDDLFDAGKVLARRFNALGEPLGQEFQVDQSGSAETAVFFNGGFGFADLIDIAVNGIDEFIVVWQDSRTDTFRILARMFDGNGAAITDEFRVDQTPFGASPVAPAVAIDSKNNDIIVAWTRISSSDNLVGVFAKRFNSSGEPISDEFRVDFNSPVGNLDIVTDAFDRVVVVWVDQGDDLGEDVFARRFDNNNTFLDTPFQVDIDPTEFSNEPIDASAIAADNNGGFAIVWRESDEVLYRRYDASAIPVTSEINVAVSNGVGSSFPDVAVDNQNIVAIIYPRREAQPEFGDLIFAQRFDENDEPIGEEFRVDQGGAIDFNTQLAIAAFSTGSFVSTWQANELTPQESFIGKVYANIVGTPFPKQNVVLNEILYDPNYDDLGAERIELKNVSSDLVSFDNWILTVTQIVDGDTLFTRWSFPDSVKLSPGKLLVVHWLEDGSNDEGNLFTGLPGSSPNDTLDAFTGNNSASPDKMLLAGPTNNSPFGLALMAVPGGVDRVFASIGLVDAVIVGDLFTDPGKPPPFPVADLVQEGYSLERSSDLAGTEPVDFFAQPNPTVGFKNALVLPPQEHLLITEVCVRPRIGEFVEIFNPSDTTLSLTDYFLTDNVNMKDEAYTLLTKGRDLLKVEPGDFFVKFPDTATIGPREFKTIAFNGDDFKRRYRKNAHYEIVDTSSVADMEVVKIGDGIPTFDDPNEVVLLLKWNQADTSDLIEDVDYFVWGKFTPPPVIPFIARLADAGENPEAVIPAGPLDEAVNKSGLGIDGLDADFVRSYYGNDTPDSLQSPVGDRTHAFLKSWQRRPGSLGVGPVEFGELNAGGNGISGHDETSENLEVAFREETPTPNQNIENADLLLLEFTDSIIDDFEANGRSNNVINPDETIRYRIELTNFGDRSTGPLQSFLRTSESVVTILDSTSTFSTILPDSSVFSSDEYVFTTSDTVLPDSLKFTLLIIQKNPQAQKNSNLNLANFPDFDLEEITENADMNYIQLVSIKPTLVVQGQDTTLRIEHRLANTLEGDCHADATQIQTTVSTFDASLIAEIISEIPITGYLDMCPGDTVDSFNDQAFVFVTNVPFVGNETPEITFRISWIEDENDASTNQTLSWQSLDIFKLEGTLRYFNDAATSIEGAIVKLETNGVIVDTDTSRSDGTYSFSPNSPGDYRVTVTHTGVPERAITEADAETACEFVPDCETGGGDLLFRAAKLKDILNLDVFTRIAADVDGDNTLTIGDFTEIQRRAQSLNPCEKFTIGKDWTFADALTTVDSENFFEAARGIQVTLGNFSFQQLDFVGIVYGDVNRDAVNPNALESTEDCSIFNISGEVMYYYAPHLPVGNTRITLNGGGVGIDTTDTVNGRFEFNGLLGELSYVVKASKNEDIAEGSIDTDDIELLTAHLEDGNQLTEDQAKAADVNGDDVVTESDLSFIESYLAGEEQTDGMGNVGHAGEWRFTPESVPLEHLNSGQEILITARLLGDVDGDWTPVPSLFTIGHVSAEIYPYLHDQKLAQGEIIDIPLRLKAEQEIQSVRVELSFDETQLNFLNIEKSNVLNRYQATHSCLNGRLYAFLSYSPSPVRTDDIMRLTFKVIGKVGETSLLELTKFSVNNGPTMTAKARIDIVKNVPKEFFLSQNFPNPFNPSTTIEYGLPKKVDIKFQIFNVLGQVVSTLVDKSQDAGYYRLEWNGRDQSSQQLPSGVYFMRIEAGQFSKIRKLTLLK